MNQIIVRLYGGLGNQMFQYATAKALASRCEMELSIDTTLCGGRTRSFCLDVFNISARRAQWRGLASGVFRAASSSKASVRCVGQTLCHVMGLEFIAESNPYHLDHSLEHRARATQREATVCLDGYWQCPGYFADAEETIRREFSFRAFPTPANQAMLDAIQSTNCISLHIRRGDYLKLKNQPVLPLFYYIRAAEVIASRVDNPHFFVFSDDIAWARVNLRLAHEMTFVDMNTERTAAEDLRLMSSCRHHVIANSSFSWWGAWLSRESDKIVVAPKYWGCTPDSYFPDLMPTGWMCLENIG